MTRTLVVTILCSTLTLVCCGANATETPADTASSSNDTLRSYLQLQEQLHSTQLALERNRKEAEELAAKNADAVAARFKAIEEAVRSQKSAELDSTQKNLQSNNRLMLIVGGSIAGIGFLVLLLTGYLQWRAVNRLAEFSAMVQSSRVALPAPSQAESQLLGAGEAAQSNGKLFGALSQLEKRIHELEHTAHIPGEAKAITSGTGTTISTVSPVHEENGATDHNALILAKGQSLLNMDKPAEALECFAEILKAQPEHAEALVKKGLALEDLGQDDEALQCYDRAIASNPDLTIAYLQKGGLFNRLERYEEALQCYEQALHAQEKAHQV